MPLKVLFLAFLAEKNEGKKKNKQKKIWQFAVNQLSN